MLRSSELSWQPARDPIIFCNIFKNILGKDYVDIWHCKTPPLYLVHVKVGVNSIILQTIYNFFDNINVCIIDLNIIKEYSWLQEVKTVKT